MKKLIPHQIKKCILFFLVTLSWNSIVFAQGNLFWENVSASKFNSSQERKIFPDKFLALHLNIDLLRMTLASAPKEFSVNSKQGLKLSFPMPDGTFKNFSVLETEVMDPKLAAKYPLIKTYMAVGVDDAYSWMRLDLSYLGFHAMASTLDGFVFIDPVNNTEIENYICYYKNDMPNAYDHQCSFESNSAVEEKIRQEISTNTTTTLLKIHDSGDELRTYRLALACTGEYAATKGGTVPGALSGMVTSINRVDGIYETEVAIRMILIANTDTLIYLNSITDPYTNDTIATMLNENQLTISAKIGYFNYDFGHVFSTTGGGIAGIGVICDNSQKAKGVTGLPNPVGDPFDVQFLSHEIGHQFGADHTFNSAHGACAGNTSMGHNFEPVSGSTIMAYSGSCYPDRVQNYSDDFYHTGSYNQIFNYNILGFGNSCAIASVTNNSPPIINPLTNYIIPFKTPFILTGSATDPDGDALTYIWEEYDSGPFGHPYFPTLNAAIFRDFTPSVDSTRTFPNLLCIINDSTIIGELLPSYARTMLFRFTARDNRLGGGGVANNYILDSIFVINTTSPFEVTLPNTNTILWHFGSSEQVTWNVSSTDIAPINCSNVNILLSLDGGYTFPYVLATNTLNDGNEMIQIPASGSIPNTNTSLARIKVESVGNIFFDMSNSNFSIQNPNAVESFDLVEKSISLFPNPTNGNLSLEINSFYTGNISVSIFDCMSRIIQHEDYTKQSIQMNLKLTLSNINPGVYFVEFKTPTNKVSKRLLKF